MLNMVNDFTQVMGRALRARRAPRVRYAVMMTAEGREPQTAYACDDHAEACDYVANMVYAMDAIPCKHRSFNLCIENAWAQIDAVRLEVVAVSDR